MADQLHLDLLRKEVTAWNQWRKDNPSMRPDLSGTNLSGADLSDAYLSRAILVRSELEGAILTDCNIYGISARFEQVLKLLKSLHEPEHRL